MVDETRRDTEQGAILFDARRLPQASPALLDPSHYDADAIHGRGGRGAVWFVDTPAGAAVLRHYRRGGMVGRLVDDRYFWTGENRTRAFREFRLLAELHDRGLSVPRPLAAGYRRDGAFYRADLLIERIPDTHTLAERIDDVLGDLPCVEALGRLLGRFHAQGVCHADLNAHNLLIDSRRRWWLIDFDRGRLRRPANGWQQRRLQRLQRSLRKIGGDRRPNWMAAWGTLQLAHDDERNRSQ